MIERFKEMTLEFFILQGENFSSDCPLITDEVADNDAEGIDEGLTGLPKADGFPGSYRDLKNDEKETKH